MLKKFSHIVLSVVLLVSTMGMIVSKHYCKGSFVSASVFLEAKTCCGDTDCCHNENQFYQVKDDFSAPVVLVAPVLAELDILGHELLNELFTATFESSHIIFTYSDSPPPALIQTTLSSLQTYRL